MVNRRGGCRGRSYTSLCAGHCWRVPQKTQTTNVQTVGAIGQWIQKRIAVTSNDYSHIAAPGRGGA